MIQIDGLSRRELENAIEQGRMPFLKSLLDRQGYRLHSFYSGLPSSTPAVQGELFYGIKTAVPAFGFVDHETDQSVLMFSPDAAAKVQQRISDGRVGLLHGGSSYCNIYDGGADESHFCAASIGWDQILRAVRPSRLAVVLIGYGFSLVRATGLVFVEIWIGLFDFLRRAITGRELWQELLMIASRVVVAVGLRELTIVFASMDAARGLPIIHLNLLGYDEHAHRRGPSSRFARDHVVRTVQTTARLNKAVRRRSSVCRRSRDGFGACVASPRLRGDGAQRVESCSFSRQLRHPSGSPRRAGTDRNTRVRIAAE
ncbi:hypothetical protein U8335_15185 [Roseiconus lacunae]|uniref:hypothetical protein n=1 Tax=Roseiconus lacunae TaxID=2605694 RepID=UPI00308F17E8|nr:hypothetical protein U8335_15185 [Stieleria sp. HD01]